MASELSGLMTHDLVLKSLTMDQTARSVVVTNFPLQSTAETIAIYLLKKGLGEEIDHVHIPVKGTAVVTFVSKEAMDRTLEHPPVPEGSDIVVQPLILKETSESATGEEGNVRKFIYREEEIQPTVNVKLPETDRELATTDTGDAKPNNRPIVAELDPKQLVQHGVSNFNWRQAESDLIQMRVALDEEKQRRDLKKQELREKEKILISKLQNVVSEEQQARARVEEELTDNNKSLDEMRTTLVEEQRKNTLLGAQLNETKIAHAELEEKLQNEVSQTRKTLYDKESIIRELERTLQEAEKAKIALNEETSKFRISWMQQEETLQNDLARARRTLNDELRLRKRKEEELRNKEKILDKLQSTLEEEHKTRTAVDGQLAQMLETLEEKERNIDELQRNLKEEQRARTAVELVSNQVKSLCDDLRVRIKILEERLEDEEITSQSHQRDIRAKESQIRELQFRLNEDDRLKTRLQESVRSMGEERDRHLSIERQLRSDVAAAQEAAADSRDWIIQREEVVLGKTILGRGPWGHVREGTFRGCQVAVKEIHTLILNRRLFEREMSIASRCRHPNLLQFIGAATDHTGSPLFVTELLDTSLRHLMSDRRLTQDEILILALDVAKALNYLHLSKPSPILHRDISSANVLLWKRDESWRAKLSDFGAANFMRQQMTVNPGAMIYSAPEAFTPQESPKVDVYSFGVLMCEMCIGELPEPQRLSNQIGRVSGVLRRLIRRCVQRNPEERPTVDEVKSALEEIRRPRGRNLLLGLFKR